MSATITAHHLMYNRNDLLSGGIKPHYYCLPILKRREHTNYLIDAATSGESKFFAGSDSAPHLQVSKETDCGCAGCYTACNAIELYTEVFYTKYGDDMFKRVNIEKFERFMSINGCRFYDLDIPTQYVDIIEQQNTIPEAISTAQGNIIPLDAGRKIPWSVDTGYNLQLV